MAAKEPADAPTRRTTSALLVEDLDGGPGLASLTPQWLLDRSSSIKEGSKLPAAGGTGVLKQDDASRDEGGKDKDRWGVGADKIKGDGWNGGGVGRAHAGGPDARGGGNRWRDEPRGGAPARGSREFVRWQGEVEGGIGGVTGGGGRWNEEGLGAGRGPPNDGVRPHGGDRWGEPLQPRGRGRGYVEPPGERWGGGGPLRGDREPLRGDATDRWGSSIPGGGGGLDRDFSARGDRGDRWGNAPDAGKDRWRGGAGGRGPPGAGTTSNMEPFADGAGRGRGTPQGRGKPVKPQAGGTPPSDRWSASSFRPSNNYKPHAGAGNASASKRYDNGMLLAVLRSMLAATGGRPLSLPLAAAESGVDAVLFAAEGNASVHELVALSDSGQARMMYNEASEAWMRARAKAAVQAETAARGGTTEDFFNDFMREAAMDSGPAPRSAAPQPPQARTDAWRPAGGQPTEHSATPVADKATAGGGAVAASGGEPDEWLYRDPQGVQQGPFSKSDILEWYEGNFFPSNLPIRNFAAPDDAPFRPLSEMLKLWTAAAGPAPPPGFNSMHVAPTEPAAAERGSAGAGVAEDPVFANAASVAAAALPDDLLSSPAPLKCAASAADIQLPDDVLDTPPSAARGGGREGNVSGGQEEPSGVGALLANLGLGPGMGDTAAAAPQSRFLPLQEQVPGSGLGGPPVPGPSPFARATPSSGAFGSAFEAQPRHALPAGGEAPQLAGLPRMPSAGHSVHAVEAQYGLDARQASGGGIALAEHLARLGSGHPVMPLQGPPQGSPAGVDPRMYGRAPSGPMPPQGGQQGGPMDPFTAMLQQQQQQQQPRPVMHPLGYGPLQHQPGYGPMQTGGMPPHPHQFGGPGGFPGGPVGPFPGDAPNNNAATLSDWLVSRQRDQTAGLSSKQPALPPYMPGQPPHHMGGHMGHPMGHMPPPHAHPGFQQGVLPPQYAHSGHPVDMQPPGGAGGQPQHVPGPEQAQHGAPQGQGQGQGPSLQPPQSPPQQQMQQHGSIDSHSSLRDMLLNEQRQALWSDARGPPQGPSLQEVQEQEMRAATAARAAQQQQQQQVAHQRQVEQQQRQQQASHVGWGAAPAPPQPKPPQQKPLKEITEEEYRARMAAAAREQETARGIEVQLSDLLPNQEGGGGAARPAWNTAASGPPPGRAPSLKEVMSLEQKLAAAAAQQTAVNVPAPPLASKAAGWPAPPPPKSAKTLQQIQLEEIEAQRRIAQAAGMELRAKQAVNARAAAAASGDDEDMLFWDYGAPKAAPSSQPAAPAPQPPRRAPAPAAPAPWAAAPAALPASDSANRDFPSLSAAPQATAQARKANGAPTAPTAPATGAPAPAANADRGFGDGTALLHGEFEEWCRGQMQRHMGTSDLDFVKFLLTLSSSGEVAEYVQLYMANSPDAASFTTEFLRRKFDQQARMAGGGSKSRRRGGASNVAAAGTAASPAPPPASTPAAVPSPAAASAASGSEGEDWQKAGGAKAKGKGAKKGKGKKVDVTLLGFQSNIDYSALDRPEA